MLTSRPPAEQKVRIVLSALAGEIADWGPHAASVRVRVRVRERSGAEVHDIPPSGVGMTTAEGSRLGSPLVRGMGGGTEDVAAPDSGRSRLSRLFRDTSRVTGSRSRPVVGRAAVFLFVPGNVEGEVDQRNVTEGLGKIASLATGPGIVLL